MINVANCLNDTKVASISCISGDGVTSTCNCNNYNHHTIYCFDINNTDLYRYPNKNQTTNSNITNSQDDVPLQIVENCMNLTGTNYFWWCETLQNNLSKSRCNCGYKRTKYHTPPDFVNTKLLYNELQDTIFPFEKNQDKQKDISKNISIQNELKNLTLFKNHDQIRLDTLNSLVFICLTILLLLIFVYWAVRYTKRHKNEKVDDRFELVWLLEGDQIK